MKKKELAGLLKSIAEAITSNTSTSEEEAEALIFTLKLEGIDITKDTNKEGQKND